MDENQKAQETTQQSTPTQPQSPPGAEKEQEEKKSKKTIVIVLIIAAIILIAGGAYFLFGGSSEEVTPTPTPRGVSVETPEPTEAPAEIDKSNVTINILNGTGVEGEATYLADELKSLGYSKIDIGNADKQDNTATVITFARDLDEAVKEEISDLCESVYQNVKVVSGSPGVYQVEVITGLRKGMTPKPEATEEPEATATPEAETPSPTPEE